MRTCWENSLNRNRCWRTPKTQLKWGGLISGRLAVLLRKSEWAVTRSASLLRPVSKSGKMVGGELGDWAIWLVVEQSSKQIGIEHFGAHDLRRTCAKLCRKNGGDLEQVKFLLGYSSIQTTERSLGSEQEIAVAVNDNLGL
jgi:integrase